MELLNFEFHGSKLNFEFHGSKLNFEFPCILKQHPQHALTVVPILKWIAKTLYCLL